MPRKQIDLHRLNRRLVRSGLDFNNASREFLDATTAEIDKGIRAEVLELYKEIVTKCPKDTGRAAAAFRISQKPEENAPSPGIYVESIEKPPELRELRGDIMAEEMKALQDVPQGESIFIYNNVEYLSPLENGHSQQAPAGFIAVALRNVSAKLRKFAEEMNKVVVP